MFRALILALALSTSTLSFGGEDPALGLPDVPAPSPTPTAAPVAAPTPVETTKTPEEKPEVKAAEEHPGEEYRAVRIGLGFFNFDYAEQLAYPLKSTENRLLPMIDLAFVRSNSTWFLRGTIDLGVGTTTYDGTDQSGVPLVTETQNTFLNSEVDVGVVLFHVTDDSAIAAYTGLGAHYWRRGLVSYLEEYSWMYLPVGVNYAVTIDGHWRAGLDVAMKFPFFGLISANFSDFDKNLADGRGILGTQRTGFRIQVPVSYQVDDSANYSITVMPWFEYSALSNGPDFPVQNIYHQQVTLAHEPPSRSYRYGVILGAEIRL